MFHSGILGRCGRHHGALPLNFREIGLIIDDFAEKRRNSIDQMRITLANQKRRAK